MSCLADTSFETLTVDVGGRVDRVATIGISRPKARNALNAQVRTELKEAVRLAEKSDDVRVVVLTGDEEGRAFVAGADITELRERDAAEQQKASERPRIYEVVDEAAVPVIARINGHALGGGCELIQACDIRIAVAGPKVGQPEINLGIMPGGGGTQRLPRLVGKGRAATLILTGELISTERAAEIGLVDEVHNEKSFDDRVYEIAASIAEKSPLAVEAALEALDASTRLRFGEGIDYEAKLFVSLFDTEDKQEGMDAFFEDRDPEFIGQ